VAETAAQPFQPAVCPHCGKEFEAELLVGSSAPEARGFKCPHCRLFVPAERAKDPNGD
jgi:predicted Zn-ribbon and HTH transcriptional regulator